MSVTYARGFRASATAAGLKPSGRPDLGLLVADRACSAAGLFTTNAFPAAPVTLSRSRLADGLAQAVVVNSGQANAGTGPPGAEDAAAITSAVAGALELPVERVLACSTGVIGARIPRGPVMGALHGLAAQLSKDGGEAFADAIRTTDTVPKLARAEAGGYRVGGCAKGVGMIAPDLALATMLAFVTTDARVPADALRELATTRLEPAFESITVDGCTSTNDTVLLLASGAADGEPLAQGTPQWAAFVEAVEEVGRSLVAQLAADAEGVTHVLQVHVTGAETDDDARTVARAIGQSLLVKTAAFGGDPNPGRILQAIGSSGASFDPAVVSARIGDVPAIVAGRVPPDFESSGLDLAREVMKEAEFAIGVSLGDGRGRASVLGSDLSYEYVRINAEYMT